MSAVRGMKNKRNGELTMTKRIEELIEQATTIEYGVDNGFDRVTFDKEKFAESIVVECASICYNSGMQDSDAHAQNLLYEFNINNCRNDK